MLRYTVIDTEMGWVAVMSSEKGLVATTLPQRSVQYALMALGRDIGDAVEDPRSLKDITVRLQAYFQGEFIEFHDKIDPQGTPFQKQVWAVTRRITYGQTQSYLWVAREIKRPLSARAVGQALGANPLPIIVPCHRVLASSGKLGGFGGGLDMKQKLLQMESRRSNGVKI
jgi:methylated-DNA-[protein]-cysteine S-methyltransferase